ncbi:MAG: hypothetical protein QM504_11020 [Pseudomonadota bacterium]
MIIVFMATMALGADPVIGITLAMAPPIGYADLDFEDGQDNMAGTQLLAYYIPIADVETLPGYVANPAALGDYGTVDTAIICKTGKNFLKLYASPDSGKIDDNKIEGKDANSFESIYEFFFPKNDAASIGFQRVSGTGKFLVIVLEADGNKRLMGIKPGVPAIVASVAASSGTQSSGEKGATFQFKSLQNGPAPIYTAEIPLTPAA